MAVLHPIILLGILVGSTLLVLERRWPPIQTAFFLAEMLILLMKMHSYITSNKEAAHTPAGLLFFFFSFLA